MEASKRTGICTGIFIISCLAALIVPYLTSFNEGDYFYYVIRDASLRKEWKETALWTVLSGPCVFLLKDVRKKAAALSVLAGIFSYMHCTFLPMIAGFFYVFVLFLSGDFVRGAGLVICLECLLSLIGIGSPSYLRLSLIILSCILIAVKVRGNRGTLKELFIKAGTIRLTAAQNLVLLTVFIVFLIQAGRMNGTLDYDSLWYGVRSASVLAPGKGIYENTGLLGIVYTYSKGFEVLGLPLSDFRSHSYVLFLNTWLFIAGLYYVYRLTLKFTGEKAALFSVVFTALTPGIVCMCVSAKPDMITWLLQIIMLERFFAFERGEQGADIYGVLSACILSLCMKPTAVVFSTALFGMMFLWCVYKKRLPGRISRASLITLAAAVLALIGIWGRTFYLTGVPFTSVFSGILTKLGFTVKYPFKTAAVPQNYQDRAAVIVLFDRIYHMLLAPVGHDMNHVAIAWGGSIFLSVITAVLMWTCYGRRKIFRGPEDSLRPALFIFIPFILVNMVSLSMLYQVDGNYFMTLYSVLLLLFTRALADAPLKDGRKLIRVFLLPLLVFQFIMMTGTNWASGLGFTEPVLNRGSYDHKAYERQYFDERGAGEIYQYLKERPQSRVIAIAEHPYCLALPGITQSFDDTFDTWGNPDVVYSAGTYEEYMRFQKTDYIYMDPVYFENGSHRRARLIFEGLMEKGVLEKVCGDQIVLYRVVLP